MKSMTGYGHSSFISPDYTVECEIKSYNNRYLDIVHNISPGLSQYEAWVDGKIKEKARRGRIEFSLRLHVIKSNVELAVDEGLVMAYREAFSKIADLAETPLPLISDYASIDGLITAVSSSDSSAYKEGVEKSVFAVANIGLVAAMLAGGFLYAFLTFVLKCEVPPVRRR